ncbi:MAG: hypothetical protein M0Z42_02470 [Actinomycetota bacterium]|nr:hypothetical protein [Actinomycetota bacterium]
MTDVPDPGVANEPTNEELSALHEQLVEGADPTTPARLAELLVGPLRRRFRGFTGLDWDTVDSTVGWSIARYLREPARFDPARGGLLPYLWQDIRGDLLNEVERGTVEVADGHESAEERPRRARREVPDSDAVEVERDHRNPSVDEEVLDAIDPYDLPPALVERARTELGRFDQRDQALLDLLGGRVRETTPYAEVLGIAHLDVDTQRREVKRHKDRLKARLEVIRANLTTPR